jgi:hypothetical protein
VEYHVPIPHPPAPEKPLHYLSQKDVLRLDRLYFGLSRHEHLIVEVAGVDHRCPRGNIFGDDGRCSDGRPVPNSDWAQAGAARAEGYPIANSRMAPASLLVPLARGSERDAV